MKQLLFLALFLLSTTASQAQQRPNQPKSPENREARREKIESLKIAHIAQKLNLDPKTAEVFWPVYNQYENEMRGVIEERRAMKKGEDINVDQVLSEEQKALDIKKKYSAQFTKIIGQNQVSNLFQAEKEFRQMLMKRAREGREGGKGPQGGRGPQGRPQGNFPHR